MAPPRITKASSHNSTTTSATRQGSKNPHKQTDEDLEEVEEFDDAGAMDFENEDHDEEPEEPRSTSAQELIANMVQDVGANVQL